MSARWSGHGSNGRWMVAGKKGWVSYQGLSMKRLCLLRLI